MTIRAHNDWLLTPYRLAIHEPTATAVIADVHLGYREARQLSGEAVPLLSVAAQLEPLGRARRRYSFRQLVVAGDLFERHVCEDLVALFLDELNRREIRFAGLVPGNHDRGWERFQTRLPIIADGFELGGWRIVHGDHLDGPGRCVMGHWHPATCHAGVRCPCYLVGSGALVLPAFSKDAAGQRVDFPSRFGACRRYVISGNRVVEATPVLRRTTT